MRTNRFRVVQGGQKKGPKIWRKIIVIGIAVLAFFLLWNSIGYLAVWAAEVTVAVNREIVTSVPVECFVLREEHLLYSPATGTYTPLVGDGAKVRKGEDVATVEDSGTRSLVKASTAGLILHTLDGQEGNFSLSCPLDSTLIASIAHYLEAPPQTSSVAGVKSGDLVGTIITNAGFKLVTGLNFHAPDQKQVIEAEDGNTYTLIPRNVCQTAGRFWVLWDVSSLADALGRKRLFSAQLVTQREEAVLVPAKSLCTKDGVQGVFVLFRGKPVFNPIEVVSSLGNEVGVKGLAHGQRVLTIPWWASFAKRWWLK